MLRQTLEYELTLLRTQHGKQTAFTHQLQIQFNQANESIQQLQTQIQSIQLQKDQKDQTIKTLRNEAETLHERERFSSLLLSPSSSFSSRRIEALNDQIHKMESLFFFFFFLFQIFVQNLLVIVNLYPERI